MAKSARPNPQSPSPRDAIISAFIALAAERGPASVSLESVASRAGVTLAQLRAEFGSWFDILAAFIRSVDIATLEGVDAALADQPVRERLFDILMRRLDVLGPHKPAVSAIADAARRDPGLAMGLNRLAIRSHQWMLTASGADATGHSGTLRAQAMAAMFARVVQVWLGDDDPALARTMKALDEQLDRAERGARMLADIERLTAPICDLVSAVSRRRDGARSRWTRDGERGDGWRGDDLRDPRVTPV